MLVKGFDQAAECIQKLRGHRDFRLSPPASESIMRIGFSV